MDERLERLGEAIAEIWLGEIKQPLAEIEYVNGDGPLGAAVGWYKGGYRVIVQKHPDTTETMRRFFHEMAHCFIGLETGSLAGFSWEELKDAAKGVPEAARAVRACGEDAAEEARCNRLADVWVRVWKGPVTTFVTTGDPGPINEILAAEKWTREQTAKARADRAIASARRKAREVERDADQRFAQIAKAHGVVRLERVPYQCSPVIEFGGVTAAKAAGDLEIETMIRERWPWIYKNAEMLAFVRRVLLRRKKYVAFVTDLIKNGLLPGMAAA